MPSQDATWSYIARRPRLCLCDNHTLVSTLSGRGPRRSGKRCAEGALRGRFELPRRRAPRACWRRQQKFQARALPGWATSARVPQKGCPYLRVSAARQACQHIKPGAAPSAFSAATERRRQLVQDLGPRVPQERPEPPGDLDLGQVDLDLDDVLVQVLGPDEQLALRAVD